MQYLYLIKCQQFYKIGIANDVQSRLAQLSTGNPFELQVIRVFGYENAEVVERAIHQRFSQNRRRGEWFELDTNDLRDFETINSALNGWSEPLPVPVEESEIEEAEVLAEPTEGGKWDFAAMFADGWCMEPSNSQGKKYYWVWRKRRVGEAKGYIYGGRISDLPYPDIEVMRRVYRDGEKP
jgi:hypothetical protein